MRRICAKACLVLSATVLLGGNAIAQNGTGTEADIIVTADLPTRSEVTAQARNISIIGDPMTEPLPRFQDWLCPGVLGLTAEGASYMIQRLRFNAEKLGLRLAKDDGDCEPNMIIAFVDDGQETITSLARNQGYLLAGLSVSERGELFEASGGARVWTNTLTRTRDGMPVQSQRDAASAPERTGSEGGGSDMISQFGVRLPPAARMQTGNSRIFVPIREDIVSVLILFDRNEVRGKSLLQLADYATMRGFAFTRETRGEAAAQTILSLFDGEGEKPDRMTDFDLAYLTSLYEGIPNLPAATKIGGVGKRMEVVAEADE